MRGVSACNKVHRPFSPIDAFISVRTSILGPEATEVVQCSRSVYSLNGGGDSYTTFTMKECSLGRYIRTGRLRSVEAGRVVVQADTFSRASRGRPDSPWALWTTGTMGRHDIYKEQ